MTLCNKIRCVNQDRSINLKTYISVDGKKIYQYTEKNRGVYSISGRKQQDGNIITVSGNRYIGILEDKDSTYSLLVTYDGGNKCTFKNTSKFGNGVTAHYRYYVPIKCQVFEGNIFAK
ncbi:MAG: hypothetical protein BroJett030_07740 [Alphaproteobacteria bacterium]|nr:MAG: hypothetical protein BroJett030_07740 [Alphaproteobacteria bacterium]